MLYKDVKIALQPVLPTVRGCFPSNSRPTTFYPAGSHLFAPSLATCFPLPFHPLLTFFTLLQVFAKTRSTSPLLATLTHSCSRKSFVCHSYENTRDGIPNTLSSETKNERTIR